MTNTTKHKIPKLTFNKITPDRTDDSPSTLEFEYPEGTKHAFSFFFYPDTIVVHNDITNKVASAQELCGSIFKPITLILPESRTLDLTFINSDLFHNFLEVIVKLFNEQSEKVNHDLPRIRHDISNIMAPYHFIMLAGAFNKESIGITDIDFTDIEMSIISSSMVMNIVFIISALIDTAYFKAENNQ